MEWFKKHTDAIIVLGGILPAILWMNGRFSTIDERLNSRFGAIDERLHDIDKRLVKIETILYMKGLIPPELYAINTEEK